MRHDSRTRKGDEYGKRCQMCHKNRRSRMFFRAIHGKFLRLCSSCWDREAAPSRDAADAANGGKAGK